MAGLAIIKPLSPVTIMSGSTSGIARALTPDPKEAFAVSGGFNLIMDFGAEVTIDSGFIGYITVPGNGVWNLAACNSSGTITEQVTGNQSWQPLGLGPPFHVFAKGTARTSRYFRIDAASNPQVNWRIGVIAFGLAFQPVYGHEYGSGRTIDDTGTADRLFGGGFGIDDGVAASGYQWTFGDLQPLETRQLYQLMKDRRTTRSVLVVEDPDQTDGLNERLHWGLFRKLEPFERLNPLDTKWSLQVADWA